MLRLSRKHLTPKSAKFSRRSSTSPPWSDLTPLALERIRDLLDSSLYDVRLRSVCRNWRSSLASPRHQNRSPNFPINLPRIPETEGDGLSPNPVMPNRSCIYHISPAEDPSDGWLVKSLDSTPNTFTLLDPLNTYRVSCPPNTVGNSLDLLRLRVSEVCKCYRLDGVDSYDLRKVLLLPNFVKNVAFTVLVVVYSGNMYYCNDGDMAWTSIAYEDYKFHDVMLFNGVYYAVSEKGCLVSLNLDPRGAFHFNKVLPPLDLDHLLTYNYKNKKVVDNKLVVFKSDLYLVSEISLGKWAVKPHEVHIFKWMLNCWSDVTSLGDTILLASSDVSVGLSAKDFKGCKGNCIYLTHPFLNSPYDNLYSKLGYKRIPHEEYDVYDLGECKILSYKKKRRRTNMFWPPPSWMQQPIS